MANRKHRLVDNNSNHYLQPSSETNTFFFPHYTQQTENFDPLCSQPKNIIAKKPSCIRSKNFTEQSEKGGESIKKKKNRTKSKTKIRRSKTRRSWSQTERMARNGRAWEEVGWRERRWVGDGDKAAEGDERDLWWQEICKHLFFLLVPHVHPH